VFARCGQAQAVTLAAFLDKLDKQIGERQRFFTQGLHAA
jgi:hypothetical protein